MATTNIEQKINLLEARLNTTDLQIGPYPSHVSNKDSEQKSPSIETLYDEAVSAFHREQFDGKKKVWFLKLYFILSYHQKL